MNLLQIIAVASMADPEGARRALESYQETYVVAVGIEAGLSQTVIDLALTGLRNEREITLRREAGMTK